MWAARATLGLWVCAPLDPHDVAPWGLQDLVDVGGQGFTEVSDHGLLETGGGVHSHELDKGLLEELVRHASSLPRLYSIA